MPYSGSLASIVAKTGAKLLDFGLAKLHANDGGTVFSADSNLPTEQISITGAGTIVGTFQYMAPEQLEAGAVDSRTDIFAFGMIVHEMATGKKAFTGKSQASLIGAILHGEPSSTNDASGPGPGSKETPGKGPG
ncbi:MAG TPA: protein kinase [Blastocatellia bacterium]|nr:protein kinase [Blastocatellia bacterium]